MPLRPPKSWINRCSAHVRASGTADDPAAVCAAVWNRKSDADKRAIVREEEMAAKKKKKKHGAKKSKAKKHHKGVSKRTTARKSPKRAKKKKTKAKRSHAHCARCKHPKNKHHKSAGCTVMKGKSFCMCPGYFAGTAFPFAKRRLRTGGA